MGSVTDNLIPENFHMLFESQQCPNSMYLGNKCVIKSYIIYIKLH